MSDVDQPRTLTRVAACGVFSCGSILPTGAQLNVPLEPTYNAFVYAYGGAAEVGPIGHTQTLPQHTAGVLSAGSSVRLAAGPGGVRFLMLAARPLREPVVQYGPFVMNTREEIEPALADFRSGRLAAAD